MSEWLRVAIIGIGPAGLAAAKAAMDCGGSVWLFSKSLAMSPLYGCQYLHKPIQGYFDVPQTTVQYELRGSPDDYRRKVYGDSWDGRVSPDGLTGEHSAWDLRTTYQRMYNDFITRSFAPFTPLNVSGSRLREVADDMRSNFDLVISTVPTTALCFRGEEHTFRHEEIYAAGDAPGRGLECPIDSPADTIICNGEPEPSWYRISKVFGHGTVEWPSGNRPPYEGVTMVAKPLWTDCDCFPWIDRLGRYGSWRKEILVHDVYQQTEMLYKSKSGAVILRYEDRKDWCQKCGRIAYSSRPLFLKTTEYRCLSGHMWEVNDDA